MVSVSNQHSPYHSQLETQLHDCGVVGRSERMLPSALIGQKTPTRETARRLVNMYRIVNDHRRAYKGIGALVDRGANGGIAGSDTRVIYRTKKTIALSGIDNHIVRNLELVHAATVVKSQAGEVILVMRQFTYMPDGKTIMGPIQMEHYGCIVQDISPMGRNKTKVPYVQTPDGYMIPMRVTDGLLYIDTRVPSDDDFRNLPATFITAAEEWDANVLDGLVPDAWYKEQDDKVKKRFVHLPFTADGELKDVEDTVDVDRETEPSRHVSRASIMAYLCKIIEEELENDFVNFEAGGMIVSVATTKQMATECNWIKVNRSLWVCNNRRKKSRGPPTRRSKRVRNKGTTVEDGATAQDATPQTDFNNKAKEHTNGDTMDRERHSGPYLGTPEKIDYTKMRRYFCGLPEEVLKKTVRNTTMMGVKGAIQGLRLYQHLKSPNPALNVPRRNKPVATDTIYGPVPAICNGSEAAQFFVGRKSDFCAVEASGKSDKDFPKTLMNHIRKYGAMDMLMSDNAAAQISQRVEEILRTFCIKDWQSEPHNKNQNYSERRWQDVKRMTEYLLNNVGAPANTWLLACTHVCMVLNHTASEKLGGRTPAEWLLGYTPDITPLVQFMFYEPVYYKVHTEQFPDPSEALGRYVGVAETVGNAMSFKILTETGKIITRSVVRTATKGGPFWNIRAEGKAPNLAPLKPSRRLRVKDQVIDVAVETDPINTKVKPAPQGQEDESNGEESPNDDVQPETVRIRTAMEDIIANGGNLPEVNINEIIGKSFISMPNEKGEQKHAKITDVDITDEKATDRDEQLLKFRCKVGEKTFEEILTYNQMLNWIDKSKVEDQFYVIDSIIGHRASDQTWPDGSRWEVNIRWASDDTSWEPLNTIKECDPITVALYAEANNLLKTSGWKRLSAFTKKKKIIARMANQAKLKNFRNRPIYKYGEQIPRNHAEAVWIDEQNGNTRWQDSEKLEINQLLSYNSFKDLGLGAPIPEGYKRIPAHFVYDGKEDGRAKGRFVAGGNRTDTPVDSTYSGVVSLRGIRIVTFLAELNGMELWSTDVGNAYLESYTSEKVCIIAGPEFGELAGHTLQIVKAQYGLKTSGKCWHDKLHDVLRDLKFVPSKAEEDIWMRDMGDHYEYVATYVDDLMIASHNPQAIIQSLENKPVSFKLKGTGPVRFHLGCDYFRDEDNILCVGPKKYIERTMDEYRRLYGEYPSRKCNSPLEKGDHPELDDSELLDEDGIRQYQSLIGSLQWTISLGRFDIATAVMTMSSFRVAPRRGHLDRVKRICGFLYKFKEACIRVRTEIPDYSDLPVPEYDWTRSVYAGTTEQVPDDAPEPKGKPVQTTTYKDANLNHCLITGKAVSGVLHLINQTPVDWFTKKQATVESATYGSEYVAGRSAVEQIAALRLTLRYLGVPLIGPSYLFGDNESVVKSSTIPHSLLHKRHHALSYHAVRAAIASGAVRFYHIPGTINPADILSKHWGHSCVYHELLKPLLFYRGDTIDLLDEIDTNAQTKGGERQNPVETGIGQADRPQVGQTDNAREAS